jgi:hypothetical protein
LDSPNLRFSGARLMTIHDVQSTAHQTIKFGLCTVLIPRALALIISNYKCKAWHAVDRTDKIRSLITKLMIIIFN